MKFQEPDTFEGVPVKDIDDPATLKRYAQFCLDQQAQALHEIPKRQSTARKAKGKRAAYVSNGRSPDPFSIRQIVRNDLLQGKTNEEIAQKLAEAFPTSKAAQNPDQHIGYYRSQLRREGLLARPGKEAK